MTASRRLGFFLVVAILALFILAATAATVRAKPAAAQCWFADGYLYATGLPTTYPYSVTSEPYPSGTTSWSVDGTLAVLTWATDAFFWVRGHGKSLIKAGPQLNDYHLIAECHA
jgi:hypothetical protein